LRTDLGVSETCPRFSDALDTTRAGTLFGNVGGEDDGDDGSCSVNVADIVVLVVAGSSVLSVVVVVLVVVVVVVVVVVAVVREAVVVVAVVVVT
jgi:hypothetical protein